MKTLIRLILVAGMTTMLVGCGITGDTRVMTLKPTRAIQEPVARIEVGAVQLEPEGSRLDAVAVFHWGEFTEADLQKLKESLQNTISAMQSEQPASSINVRKLFVILRRYHMTTSSSSGACLACVAWCAVNEQGEIIYHEQFYASASGSGVITVGGIKEQSHHSENWRRQRSPRFRALFHRACPIAASEHVYRF